MPLLIGLAGYADASAAMTSIGCSPPTARLYASSAGPQRVIGDQHPGAGSLLTVSNGVCTAADGRPVTVALLGQDPQ